MKDNVNHPDHYGGKDNVYEVIKIIEHYNLDKDAYLFNTVKYILRAGKKDSAKYIEDLKKALFYLDRRIKNLEKEEADKNKALEDIYQSSAKSLERINENN